MTLWDVVLITLKENSKRWNDIKFITSRKEYYYYNDNDDKFNVSLDNFESYSKMVSINNVSFNIKLVGDGFWLDTGVSEAQRVDYHEIPKMASNTINLAKELLVQEETDPLIILGLAIDYKE